MPFGLGVAELLIMLVVFGVGLLAVAFVIAIVTRTVLRFDQERRGGAGPGANRL